MKARTPSTPSRRAGDGALGSVVRTALLGAAMLAAPSGCSTKPPQEPAGAPAKAWALEKTFTGGPVSLVLRLDKVEASLADTITLEEELRVEPGFEADFPEYLPEDFEGFSVVDIEAKPPAAPAAASPPASAGPAGEAPPAPPAKLPAAGSPQEGASGVSAPLVRRKRLTLEPQRSGKLAIAPLAVYFHREGAAEESQLLSDELTVEVTGISDPDALALRDLRGLLRRPLEARFPWAPVIAGSAGGLVAILGAILCWRRRRRRRPAAPRTPPHELAYEALRRLVALGLVEKGQLELFFVHLSRILRDYVEARFEVRAPERTTEEFLAEASTHPALAQHGARLGLFLALCDRVKFGRFQPDDAAIQGAFDVVRAFLAETSRPAQEAQAA